MSQDEIEARKEKAVRGWLADPPPKPPRESIPGEENKWFLMMGARHLISKERDLRLSGSGPASSVAVLAVGGFISGDSEKARPDRQGR